MTWEDHAYFRCRATEERAAADRAACAAARDRHLQLAALYRQRAEGREMGILLRPNFAAPPPSHVRQPDVRARTGAISA